VNVGAEVKILRSPHAGAWIETGNATRSSGRSGRRPSRGAWIETPPCRKSSRPCPVAPVDRNNEFGFSFASTAVAPHAGAWIGTTSPRRSAGYAGVARIETRPSSLGRQSPPVAPHGRGSKQRPAHDRAAMRGSPLTRGVDRNMISSIDFRLWPASPLTRGVDRNRISSIDFRLWPVSPGA